MLLFLAIVFAILGVVSAIWCIGSLAENNSRNAVTPLLVAILMGALCVTLGNANSELNTYRAEVGTLNNQVVKLERSKASLEYINGKQTKAIADAEKKLENTQYQLRDAKLETIEALKERDMSRTEITILQAELKAAQEATKFDRDRMAALEQENGELKAQLQGIMEAVQ